jgi:hypothetical protein
VAWQLADSRRWNRGWIRAYRVSCRWPSLLRAWPTSLAQVASIVRLSIPKEAFYTLVYKRTPAGPTQIAVSPRAPRVYVNSKNF